MLTGQALQAGTVAAESEHPVRNMTPRSCVSVNPGEGYAGERGDARSGRRSCDERDRVRRVQSGVAVERMHFCALVFFV